MKIAHLLSIVAAMLFSTASLANTIGAERCVGTAEDANVCANTGRYRVEVTTLISRCVFLGGPNCTQVDVPGPSVGIVEEPYVDQECNIARLDENCLPE